MQLIKIQHCMKYLIAVWSLYPVGLPEIFQFVPKRFVSLHQNPVLIKWSESKKNAEFLLHQESNVSCTTAAILPWSLSALLPSGDILACHSSDNES